jgi:peptidoglycan/LPS O-acetylase OafA/YrhL
MRSSELTLNSGYLPSLDGLRAISIILVVVSHFGLGAIVPGGLGVTVFFFVSGFIITRLILGEYDKSSAFNFGRFYLRRFIRLSPALIVYVAVSVSVFIFAGGVVSWKELVVSLFYMANYYHIFVGFSGLPEFGSPLVILWSLAIEEHYYLLYPLLLWGLGYDKRRLLIAFGFIGVICLVWRIYLVYGVGLDVLHHDRLYKGTDTRLDSILYGAVLSVMIWKTDGQKMLLGRPIFFILGLCFILLSLLYRGDEFRETIRYSMQGIALIPIAYGLLFVDKWKVVRKIFEVRPLVILGRWSYSLYLYHWLSVCLADWIVGARYSFTWISVAIVFSLIGTLISYYFVETPFLGLRRRLGSHAI